MLGSLAVVLLLAFFLGKHSVPIAAFDNIAVGMTQAQVKVSLGVPQQIRHDPSGAKVFCYGGFRRMRWCVVEVIFGPDDRVISKFHDH
jgi:hypothetical protein